MPGKVLICEDERIIHEFIRKTLRDGGIESLSAYTGKELCALLARNNLKSSCWT